MPRAHLVLMLLNTFHIGTYVLLLNSSDGSGVCRQKWIHLSYRFRMPNFCHQSKMKLGRSGLSKIKGFKKIPYLMNSLKPK